MTQRSRLLAALVAPISLATMTASATTTVPAAEAVPASRPNVITIVADDLGFADTSLYGGTIDTPNIDRLAAEGVTFTDGYVSSPVCSPSRWALMSGREAPRLGADNNHIARHQVPHFTDTAGAMPSMASLLQERGYQTMALGKWDLSGVRSRTPEGTIAGDDYDNLPHTVGFDEFWGILAGISRYCPQNAPDTFGLDPNTATYHREQPTQYLTDEFSQRATDWLGTAQQSEDPFFLYLSYNAPHGPHETRTECDRTSDRDVKRVRYEDMVRIMDEGIGQVLDSLDPATRANTMITFVSDNGPEHGWHTGPLRGRKSMLFEGGVRVPYVTSWPGHLPQGELWREPVSTLDLLPTVMNAADPSFDTSGYAGSDLVGKVTGGGATQPYVWRYYNDSKPTGAIAVGTTRMAVRDGRWKWVREVLPDGAVREHLYDLGVDADDNGVEDTVGERDNLFDRPEHAERVQHMRHLYRDWAASVEQHALLTAVRNTGRPDGFVYLGDVTWSLVAGADGSSSTGGFAGTATGAGGQMIAPGTYHRDDVTTSRISLGAGGEAGIALRATIEPGDHRLTGYVVVLTARGVRLERHNEGAVRVLGTAEVAEGSGQRELRVTATGERFVVHVDGVQALDVTDHDAIEGGSTGLRVASGSATFHTLDSVPR